MAEAHGELIKRDVQCKKKNERICGVAKTCNEKRENR